MEPWGGYGGHRVSCDAPESYFAEKERANIREAWAIALAMTLLPASIFIIFMLVPR
jgi:hypothetical protein